jgi:hypothetical protein
MQHHPEIGHTGLMNMMTGGVIRSGEIDDHNIGRIRPPAAKATPLWCDYDFDVHRENGTDPMAANGKFIVALVNAYRSGDLVPRGEST